MFWGPCVNWAGCAVGHRSRGELSGAAEAWGGGLRAWCPGSGDQARCQRTLRPGCLLGRCAGPDGYVTLRSVSSV